MPHLKRFIGKRALTMLAVGALAVGAVGAFGACTPTATPQPDGSLVYGGNCGSYHFNIHYYNRGAWPGIGWQEVVEWNVTGLKSGEVAELDTYDPKLIVYIQVSLVSQSNGLVAFGGLPAAPGQRFAPNSVLNGTNQYQFFVHSASNWNIATPGSQCAVYPPSTPVAP